MNSIPEPCVPERKPKTLEELNTLVTKLKSYKRNVRKHVKGLEKALVEARYRVLQKEQINDVLNERIELYKSKKGDAPYEWMLLGVCISSAVWLLFLTFGK